MADRPTAEAGLAAELDEARRRIAVLEAAAGASHGGDAAAPPTKDPSLPDAANGCTDLLERLRESEERFRRVSMDSSDAIVLARRDQILSVNGAFLRLTGYEAADIPGLALTALVAPEQRGELDAWARCRVDGGDVPSTYGMRLVRKDGFTRDVEATCSLLAVDGEPCGLAILHDVTERAQVEQALRASEVQCRSLIENLDDIFCRYDLDLRFIYVSPAMERIMGLRPEDLIGKTHREAGFVEPLCELFDDTLRRAIETGHAVEVEFVAEGTKGEIVAEARAFPEHDADGRPVAVMTVTRDVTARKRAEEALRESETRYRIAIDNTYDWEWWEGPDGSFVYCSPGCETVTGYGPEEFAPGPERLLAITHPDDRGPLHDHLVADIASAEGPSKLEFRLVDRDGRERAIEHRCQPVFGDDGTYLGRRSSNRDVTEPRRAEHALRASEAMRTIAEQVARVGSWRLDLKTREVAWSPGMYELFGVTSESCDGDLMRILPDSVHPDDKAAVEEATATAIATGEAGPIEYRVTWPDGTEHILHGDGSVERDEDGRAVAIIGYYQDVSEQRRAEAEIRRLNEELRERVVKRTEQLDAATRELEALAYSIAHDVRAPLRTIDGFSAAVIEDELGHLSPEGVTALRRVRGATQTLARLLDDLMGLSHVSRRELSRHRIDLTALAEDVCTETAADYPSRTASWSIAPGLTAHADPGLTRLILRELLGNAWKFTAPHEKTHVEVGALDVDDERAFFVRDDGVGFDMRYAQHLFGVFQRMHPPGEFEGDGVGLATVQRLVRRHGGRVWAESVLGAGTTVFFTLPDPAGVAESPGA